MAKLSLRVSLGSAFVAAVVLTSAALGLTAYATLQTALREGLRQRLGELAGAAAAALDVQAHAVLRHPDEMAGEPYQSQRALLRRLKAASPDLRFAYTFRRADDGTLSFVLDSGEEGVDFSPLGEVYEDATDTLLAAFEAPYQVQIEEDFYTDRYGTWLSAFAPLVTSEGRLEGVLGLDMDARVVAAYGQQFLLSIVLVAAGVTLLFALLGWLLARRISKPLIALAGDMGRIQKLELDGEVDVDSRIAEVKLMETSLDNMKKGLRSFRKYVPGDLVTELMSLQKEAVLETERREISVYFSDMENFTNATENLSPEELSALLGVYFETVTKVLQDHGATVDKFIGDAVMAFWNAPRSLEDHAVRSCRATLAVQKALEPIQQNWRAKGIQGLRTRVGLNTGLASVGNIGYTSRLSYTALGDTVNTASRLEALNKVFGTTLMAGEALVAQAGPERFYWRPLDRIAVKGKSKGLLVHELRGEVGVDPVPGPWWQPYLDAWSAYEARNWDQARIGFERVLTFIPEDKAALKLAERCRTFVSAPPAATWDGVTVMTEK